MIRLPNNDVFRHRWCVRLSKRYCVTAARLEDALPSKHIAHGEQMPIGDWWRECDCPKYCGLHLVRGLSDRRPDPEPRTRFFFAALPTTERRKLLGQDCALIRLLC